MIHCLTESDLHEMVEAFAAALDAKHSYTRGHSERVADIASRIAAQMNLSKEEQEWIHIAGHLHDIGKIGIPDHILLKPGKLTTDEYNVIKQHPQIGYEILGKVKLLQPIIEMVRYHHERWDGLGYPLGIAKENIPLGARIIAVADSFDAMSSSRSYRSQLSYERAISEIKQFRGSQFDPDVVDAFFDVVFKEMWNSQEKAVAVV